MQNGHLLVPARYYLRLADVLAGQDIDIAKVFRDLRLPMASLAEPDSQLSWPQVEALLAELRRRTPRTDLGFELGKMLTVSAHSFVGFGMLNSPNVEQALHFVARYFRLVMPSFRLRYIGGKDFGELQFSPTTAMSHECLAFHLETIGMAALREVRDLSSDRLLEARLDLAMPPPPHAGRYALIPNLLTQFHAEQGATVRLRVLADLSAIPLVAADNNALKVAEERCRLLIHKVTTVGRFGDLITMTLREAGEGPPSETEVAAMFNISKRTLNRYLERENTSFREIARQVLHDTARERLRTGKVSISEIAYSLGFSDAANFTRAFRNLEGCSPSEYQRAAASAAALAGTASRRGAPRKLSPKQA